MAPRKRKSEGADEAAKPAARRSSARLASKSPALPPPELPKKKKGKTAADKKEKVKPEEKETHNNTDGDDVDEQELAKEEGAEEAKEATTDGGNTKTVVIEHCKQCNSFKTRAIQVKNGLENAVPGINVLLNPDKPRRGCFEIREEGGEKFITLLDMKRPFKPMKDLDMEKVISEIIDKIK